MRTVDDGPDTTGEEGRVERLPERVQEALGELAGAAKEGLLALSVGVGPRGGASRHEGGEVTLGGRRVPVDRPRVRAGDGSGEVPLRRTCTSPTAIR